MEERLQLYREDLENILSGSADDIQLVADHVMFLREQISIIENIIENGNS